jgi:hypothetical protein
VLERQLTELTAEPSADAPAPLTLSEADSTAPRRQGGTAATGGLPEPLASFGRKDTHPRTRTSSA